MTDLPELLILDVGHGNSAILQDGDTVTLIDCPPSAVLTEVLERIGVDTITNILISHSDIDHAGGLPNLLDNIFVQNIYVNPDANKTGSKGNLWRGVRISLEKAEQEGTKIHTSLTTALSKEIYSSQVEIEILSPSIGVALGGAGGEDLGGRKLNSNAMSVVIGLIHNSHRVVLLPGDMDEIGLDNLLNKQKSINSDILVFPHHGGTPGTKNSQEFARKLCNLVQPNLVVFSHDRNKFENPRNDIIEGVIAATPKVHIMCTQLSRKCAIALPQLDFSHLTNFPAAGFATNSCCGGTILVQINGDHTTYKPLYMDHRSFINDDKVVPTPLCLEKGIFRGPDKTKEASALLKRS